MLTVIRQTFAIFALHRDRSALILAGLLVVSALLEMLGIGLLLPVIGLLADPGALARNPHLAALHAALGAPPERQLAMLLLFGLVGVFVLKNLFRAGVALLAARFAAHRQALLSARLFDLYLRQPLSFHLRRNSAELLRNLLSGSAMTVGGALMPMVSLLSESLVLVGVLLLLLVVEPWGTLAVAFAFAAVSVLYYALVRRRLAAWGAAWQQHETRKITLLHQGLGAVKELNVLGREAHVQAAFADEAMAQARIHTRQAFAGQLPPLWLETAAVLAMAALLLLLDLRGQAVQAAVPVLAVFAAAAFRLLPVVNRALVAVQQIRAAGPAVAAVAAELRLRPDRPAPAARPPLAAPRPFRAVEISGLCFRYPDAAADTLCGISFTIPAGSSVGLIGRSGAGKSTLLDLLLGVLQPTSGTIAVDGVPIAADIAAWQSRLGYVPQDIFLSDESIRANVALGLPAHRIDEAAVRRALAAAQLDGFVASLPAGLDTVVGERGVRLSGGQRQRIGIARALYHDPDVLLLDEATSALDAETEAAFIETTSSLAGRKTLVVIAHRLSTVAHCDVVHRLEAGRIVWSGRLTEPAATGA
jgi:ABC-type multidrug transport system fused ATPase/permease subunit